MQPKNDPTYIGWNRELGMWGFSPTPMTGVDRLWSVADWSWDDLAKFMNFATEFERWHTLAQFAEEIQVPE